MKEYYYGAHMSIYKGIPHAIENINKLGGNFLQIFITNPRGCGMKSKTNVEIKEINDYLNKYNTKIVIHSPYILNFARPFSEDAWWINILIKELTITSRFNSYGSVLHLGKEKYSINDEYFNLIQKDAYDNMYKSIQYVLDKTPNNSRIILETSSGQGSELGYRLEDFAKLYNKFKDKSRIGICLDTCHIFAAGYDIRNLELIKNFFKKINKLFGLENIWLIHLNDSKKELGSKIDRHANIGEGKIGKKALQHIIQIAHRLRIPIILETPGDYKEEIKLIKI